MPNKEGASGHKNDESLAFEYASGLLKGEARLKFELRLDNESSLHSLVDKWEIHLRNLQALDALESAPADNEERMNPPERIVNEPPAKWVWAMFGAMASVFLLLVFPVNPPPGSASQQASTLTVDYVAVMTDQNQQPALTAFAYADKKKLTLNWSITLLRGESKSYQLWAISKQDGQPRPIAVLRDATIRELELSAAAWQLLAGADRLALTPEAPDNTANDNPADTPLASGSVVEIRGPLSSAG